MKDQGLAAIIQAKQTMRNKNLISDYNTSNKGKRK
jgi:hypothetical protein